MADFLSSIVTTVLGFLALFFAVALAFETGRDHGRFPDQCQRPDPHRHDHMIVSFVLMTIGAALLLVR